MSFSHSSIQQTFIEYLAGPAAKTTKIKYTVPVLMEFTSNLGRGFELKITEDPRKVLIINVSHRDYSQ